MVRWHHVVSTIRMILPLRLLLVNILCLNLLLIFILIYKLINFEYQSLLTIITMSLQYVLSLITPYVDNVKTLITLNRTCTGHHVVRVLAVFFFRICFIETKIVDQLFFYRILLLKDSWRAFGDYQFILGLFFKNVGKTLKVLPIVFWNVICYVKRIEQSFCVHTVNILQDLFDFVVFILLCFAHQLKLRYLLLRILHICRDCPSNLCNVPINLMILVLNQDILIFRVANERVNIKFVLLDVCFEE